MAKMIVLFAVYSALVNQEVNIPEVMELPVYETGLASWYGSGVGNDHGLHGSITATGEFFDPLGRTAASRSIPLNTVVLIEVVSTGRRAWCRVNDRGPYGAIHEDQWVLKLTKDDPGEWRGIMDLSFGCAKSLGFDFNKGLEPIIVRKK